MSEPINAPPFCLHARLERAGFVLNVQLALPERGVMALFGPSGSGKTTCLRVLAGLERSAHATVRVSGQTWQDSERGLFVPTHQRALGYVFQEASLFEHLTVEGNLRFGFDRTPHAQRRHDWRHGLEMLGIGHLLQRWPRELSGGERQRVAIARALATSPRLLLMDEPLAALDVARKADILPWLEQLHERLDIPVVYVTHSVDEVARLADRVVLLEQGRTLAQGPVSELMTRPDLPLAQGDSAAALVEATVCGRAPADALCLLSFAGGTLVLPQTRSTPLPAQTRVRIRIQARDVSLALIKPEQTSVLNCLPATVAAITDDGPGQVLVSLDLGHPAGTTRLLSRISQLSRKRLGLQPGTAVFAQIKGVALVR
jgi:molybdate transport system ATP-binding protein